MSEERSLHIVNEHRSSLFSFEIAQRLNAYVKWGVTIILFVILILTAIPSFKARRELFRSKTVQADLLHLRKAIEELYAGNEARPPIAFFNIKGPATLPPPLSEVSISEEIIVKFIVATKRFNEQIILLAVRHIDSPKEFRWIKLFGPAFEQQVEISKN